MLSDDVNWHNDHPYLSTIREVVPTSRWSLDIEKCLLQIWVQKHYDYKLYANKDTSTFFDLDVETLKAKKSLLDEEFKKEEAIYNGILAKLESCGQCVDAQEESSSSEEQEEVPDVHQRNGKQEARIKGGQASKLAVNTIKEKKKRDALQAKTLKSSLASSQQKLIEIKTQAETFDAKRDCYIIYQAASHFYQKEMRRIVLSYKNSPDDVKLIQDLDTLLDSYTTKMHQGIPTGSCKGSGDLCEAHFLPLRVTRRSKAYEPEEVKCSIHM
jgi:hypothetical protein